MDFSNRQDYKKTLLLSVPIGMSVRNFLRTDVFTDLKKYRRIIIMTKFYRSKEFIDEFTSHNVTIIPYPSISFFKKAVIKIWDYMQYYGFWLTHKTKTMKIMVTAVKRKNIFKYLGLLLLGILFNLCEQINKNILNRIVFYSKKYHDLLLRIKPDIVFTLTTDVKEDWLLMYNARKADISVLSFVHSWDNLPAYGYFSVLPDNLLVWNDIMKQQAIELQAMPGGNIHVVGVPQYENYMKHVRDIDENEFRKYYGVPVGKKVITYTCDAYYLFPDEPEFIEELIELINTDKISESILIIRLHPTERQEEYLRRFNDIPNVILDKPESSFAATYVNWKEDRGEDGIRRFVALMKYSDVVINLASTTTIDAAIFNTPVICVSYNISLSDDQWNAAHIWYTTSHYQDIVSSGGVSIANSRDELVMHIREYLNMPQKRSSERQKMVKDQCFCLEHSVSQRIMSVIDKI